MSMLRQTACKELYLRNSEASSIAGSDFDYETEFELIHTGMRFGGPWEQVNVF